MKKKTKTAVHHCLTQVNKVLKEHNTELDSDLLKPNRIFIHTVKIESKIRGKPRTVLASHCPFCGEKL